MNVRSNLEKISSGLPEGCTLVAVSKTQSAATILEAYEGGQRHFGENKVQELVPKYEVLPKDIQWHMIGHLQSNKVKYIAPFVHLIHSIDSHRLLAEVNKQAEKSRRVISCLLQVHIAAEETKFGFSPDELRSYVRARQCEQLQHVRVVGLMGMATLTEDEHQVRQEFRTLHDLFEELQRESLPSNVTIDILSMGMSGDYRLAVAEGSTMVRVGSAIFAKSQEAGFR